MQTLRKGGPVARREYTHHAPRRRTRSRFCQSVEPSSPRAYISSSVCRELIDPSRSWRRPSPRPGSPRLALRPPIRTARMVSSTTPSATSKPAGHVPLIDNPWITSIFPSVVLFADGPAPANLRGNGSGQLRVVPFGWGAATSHVRGWLRQSIRTLISIPPGVSVQAEKMASEQILNNVV